MAFVAAHATCGRKRAALGGHFAALDLPGVGVSSFALCAVVAIMGGCGAVLKPKILGNNALVKIEAKRIGGFEHWSESAGRRCGW